MLVCRIWYAPYKLLISYMLINLQLALPRFQTLDFLKLERIVQEDAKMRYHLLLEPDQTGTSSDIWWIRANQGHTMKVVLSLSCS